MCWHNKYKLNSLIAKMPKKKRENKNKKADLKKSTPFLIHVLKTPFYIGKGIVAMNKKAKESTERKKIRNRRESMKAVYEDFDVVKVDSGDYEKWESDVVNAESKIGIILGARGSGKSAFGIKHLENVHAKTKKNCFALGFKREQMPSWIKVVDDISEIENNSMVLVDEGGILFSARRAMTNANKLMSDLILIARHKNLSILFISQNSSNLDVNIIRQADFLVLKPTSLLQKDFERNKIQKIYEEVSKDFEDLKDDKGITHIYANDFRGFVSNPLPSFWNVKISKSFSEN
jgi:hypothetical protein